MATDLHRIPGVAPRGRRGLGSRHRDAWDFGPPPPRSGRGLSFSLRRRRSTGRRKRRISAVTVLLALGYAAAGAYGISAIRSFMRVDVAVDGLEANAVLTSGALAERSIRFDVKPTKHIGRSSLELDGVPVPDATRKIYESSVLWKPGPIGEGRHQIVLSVPRPGMGDARFHRSFVVDDTPPAIGVPPLLDATGICERVTVRGKVEPSSTLTLDGAPLTHTNGSFSLNYERPPAAPLQVTATDTAGNTSRLEVVAPIRYPGGQGVHVTAAAWGYEPLRRGILALIDAKLVSSVELDLKDEGGVIGFDSRNPLANQIGAVRPEYKLKETVADLKRRGVRVVGRVVAFRDAPLAKWAWENGRRDWVVQTPGGKMLDTYGGFSNLAHPEVHRYNLDIALEAV
ncbi:MAG: hypothetical protein M3450_07055, partial [Actinomycetota bacterium]|nr:hypothetical protein [Actinomycetota bacterium]